MSEQQHQNLSMPCPPIASLCGKLPPQALPHLGFSRQEHWSGLPFPSPTCESEVAQLCLTLWDPMDCSLPGSSAHGIFQARVLEWGAILGHFQICYSALPLQTSFRAFALRCNTARDPYSSHHCLGGNALPRTQPANPTQSSLLTWLHNPVLSL